ncbi:TetR/AcrR family transcriptional regulator [soil metagenome]
MGISERKEREKDEMRKIILDAAFEMFLTEGYSGTSLREIAKKIEYSPATIYLYYKDKDALFFDIQARCFKNLLAAYSDVVKIKDPFDRLRQMGYAYMKFNIDNPQCFNLMFLHNSPLTEFKKENRMEKHGNAVGFLRDTIHECVANNQVKGSDEMILRLEVWGLTHGLTTLVINNSYKAMGLTKQQVEKHIKVCWENFLMNIKA